MENGKKVESVEDWNLRHEEIQDLYEFYMYGKLPKAEETGLKKAFAVDGEDEDHCGVVRMYDVPELLGDLVKIKEYTG